MQCVDPQTGQGFRRRHWKIKTPAEGNQGACLDVGESNQYRDSKDFYGTPCKFQNGTSCPNGGRKETFEDVLCFNRNETITGRYDFRSTSTRVPTYNDVVKSSGLDYEGLIATQVFGYDQTMKMEREKGDLQTHCKTLNISAKNCKSVVVRVLMSVVECIGF